MLLADLHTHTVASRTGMSTLHENIQVAKAKGLEYLAITDHDCMSLTGYMPAIETSRICCPRRLRTISDIKVICGVEATVGTVIDARLAEQINNTVPWRIGSFHNNVFERDLYAVLLGQLGGNTKIHPNALGHVEASVPNDMPEDVADKEIRMLLDLAINEGMFIEINTGSFNHSHIRKERMKRWLPYAAERDALFYIATDAHYCDEIGEFEKAKELLKSLGLEDVYILNEDRESLEQLYKGG